MPTLVDTNVLVYASGVNGDRRRQQLAIQALYDCRVNGALAVQVLAEFSNVLMRHGRSIESISRDVSTLEMAWSVVSPNSHTVSSASDGVKDHHMSFWDAMLWATARQNNLTTILSEDGPVGATVGGVTYVSPFDGQASP